MLYGKYFAADIFEDLVIAGVSEPRLTALELRAITVACIDARERRGRSRTIRRLSDLLGITRRKNRVANPSLEGLRHATLTVLQTPAHAMQHLLAMDMTEARARAVIAALRVPVPA